MVTFEKSGRDNIHLATLISTIVYEVYWVPRSPVLTGWLYLYKIETERVLILGTGIHHLAWALEYCPSVLLWA